MALHRILDSSLIVKEGKQEDVVEAWRNYFLIVSVISKMGGRTPFEIKGEGGGIGSL